MTSLFLFRMHVNMKLYITLLFPFLLTFSLFGQIGIPGGEEAVAFPFERVYPAINEDHFALDLDTLGNSFLTLNAQLNVRNDSLKAMNVISFDNKGNINWTFQYELKRDLEFMTLGDVEVVGDDSIVFISVIDTSSFSRTITKIGSDGGYGWSKRLDSDRSISDVGAYELLKLGDERMIEIATVLNNNSQEIIYTSFTLDGEVEFSNQLDFGTTETLVDAVETFDSTVMILSHDLNKITLTEVNDLGDIISVNTYESPLDNITSISANGLTVVPNGRFAISGIVVEAGGTPNRLILDVERDGEVKTAYLISDLTRNISVADVDASPDSSLVVRGFIDMGPVEGEPFMAQMNLDSTLTVKWSSYSHMSRPALGGFAATTDGGAVSYINGGTLQLEDRITPYLIRYNNLGKRNDLCTEQSLDLQLQFTDIISSPSNITLNSIDVNTDTLTLDAQEYNGFNPPILSLRDTTYCPQDPVDFLIDGTVNGGLGYFWEGEDFDFEPDPRMIRAKAPGMYMLTVSGRNNEQITCWTLCDTTNVNQTEFPMVEIVPNFDGYCESGEAILAAMSSNAIIEIEWSTGAEQETRISVTEPGNYSVTVTDDCGNTGVGSIGLREADFDVILPLELDIEDTFCSLGTVRVRLAGFNADPSGLSWSNGESGVASIDVTEPGTYEVVLDGICSGMGEINVPQSFFIEDGSVEINSECGNNELLLIASEENIASREWSTGNTGLSTGVTTPGTYSVTATDLCGDPVIASIEVTQEDLSACQIITGEVCMEYPNAFVPNSRNELNRTFAPKNDCGPVTDYELLIYNRWGNEVFKSEAVEIGWNGRKGDTESPADVYYFYSTYTVSGGATFEERGDLLLIR